MYHFTSFCFRSVCFIKSLPAVRKGIKRRKRGFSRVSASEFNAVK